MKRKPYSSQPIKNSDAEDIAKKKPKGIVFKDAKSAYLEELELLKELGLEPIRKDARPEQEG